MDSRTATNELSRSFSVNLTNPIGLATADLTLIQSDLVEQSWKGNGAWYYFNRLFVPIKHRNKGVASVLMEQLTNWADSNQYNVYLDINPYGDGGPGLADLIYFYSKHGFVSIGKNSMIRSIGE